MNSQAIYAMSESILPQQQGLGAAKEIGTVNFELLLTQILGNTPAEAEVHDNTSIPAELSQLIQWVAGLNKQQDQDQPIDMDAIISQLSMLLNGKMENESILHHTQEYLPKKTESALHNVQEHQHEKIENILYKTQELEPKNIENLNNSIQKIIQQLESIKSNEGNHLKENLCKIMDKITTNDLRKPDAETFATENLKQQSHLMALTRSYKNSNDPLDHDAKQNLTGTKIIEPKTDELKIAVPKNQLEAESLEMQGTLKKSVTAEVRPSDQPLNKQEIELTLPIQRLEYKKTFSNEATTQTKDTVNTDGVDTILGNSEEAELNVKSNITQNSTFNEEHALTAHKNNTDFVKIHNMDKIYAALQKQALETKSKEKSTLTVKLHPEELGKMKIQLEMVEGIVKGTILVENEGAKQALQNHLQEMKNQIKNQDISLESLEVNVENESFGESHQPTDEENAFFRQRHTMKNAFGGDILEKTAFTNNSTYSENTLNLLA